VPGIRHWHLDRDSVRSGNIKDKEIVWGDLKPKSFQAGVASATFDFTATGVETKTDSVTFPEAFDAEPEVVLITCDISDLSVAVSAKTASGFTVAASDTGTDRTTSVSVTIYWLAIKF